MATWIADLWPTGRTGLFRDPETNELTLGTVRSYSKTATGRIDGVNVTLKGNWRQTHISWMQLNGLIIDGLAPGCKVKPELNGHTNGRVNGNGLAPDLSRIESLLTRMEAGHVPT